MIFFPEWLAGIWIFPLVYLPLTLVTLLFTFYCERKIASFIQDRMGPTVVGKFGVLQPLADLVKLLQKEDIIPDRASKFLFKLAPILIFFAVFAGFCLVPLNSTFQASASPTGLLLVLGLVSLDVIGLFMAGISSQNKFSGFGAYRAIAQHISFELPLGICLLCIGIMNQTFDLQQICKLQQNPVNAYLFGIPFSILKTDFIGGMLCWNIFQNILFVPLFVIFYLCCLALCNRAPFDIPEGESEIVGGFHTEYSGLRWALFFLSEYALMFLCALLMAILFFGGWNSPFPDFGFLNEFSPLALGLIESFWMLLKAWALLLTMIWVRWTFPRLRMDQLLYLTWKVLTPIALLIFLLLPLWKYWLEMQT